VEAQQATTVVVARAEVEVRPAAPAAAALPAASAVEGHPTPEGGASTSRRLC
jgi:hypothetical protein